MQGLHEPARAAGACTCGSSCGPATRRHSPKFLPNILAYAPTEGNSHVQVCYVLGAPGCQHPTDDRFGQLGEALHDNIPYWPSSTTLLAQVASAPTKDAQDLVPLQSMVLFTRDPSKWLPQLDTTISYDYATLGQTPAAAAATAFLEGRWYNPTEPVRGVKQALQPGGWRIPALSRSVLPLGPVNSALLDFDFGSALPPANPMTGIVRGCTWPGHAREHLAARRNKMRALLQELGVLTHTTQGQEGGRLTATELSPRSRTSTALPSAPATHKRPLETADKSPAPVEMDGPSDAPSPRLGAGSHKRP